MNVEISEAKIRECIEDIFRNGPCDNDTLSYLSLCKYLNKELFGRFEKQIILLMGLFYKKPDLPINNITFPFAFYQKIIEENFSERLTPIQADIKYEIDNHKTLMFSAPTSIGKSFLLRDIVLKEEGNVIIVVPTRALLNEYIKDLRKELKSINNRTTNVLPFIEDINLAHSTKNIYVLTPERCMELLKINPNVSLFVIDEAQLSDSSQGIRSIKFRAMIKKIDTHYKNAKKMFAYPFVENLEEIKRSSRIFDNSICKTYSQRSVGQLFVHEDKKRTIKYNVLSKNGECIYQEIENPIKKTLTDGGKVLVFCEKAKIYKGEIYDAMSEYISLCKLNVDSNNIGRAIEIINKIEDKIGASPTISSQLVANLRRGVAIHHGSLPHEIRVLIEEFVNLGYAQICFSTPTLEQGINLPFDLIYIHSFTNVKSALDFKNLVGRAGRSTTSGVFDYGVVVFRNKEKYIKYISDSITVDSVSDPAVKDDEDLMKNAIINDTLDDETNMPKEVLESMSDDAVVGKYSSAIELLFNNEMKMKTDLDNDSEEKIIEGFFAVYKSYLHGRDVSAEEKGVFVTTAHLMIDKLQRKKFSQIVNERYNYTKKNNWRGLQKFSLLPAKRIWYEDVLYKVRNNKYYFDTVVYDTFEYLDKNYNLFLKDVLYAMSCVFEDKKGHSAKNSVFKNLLKYGSDDEKEIMLFRYGFVEEEIELVKECVTSVSENEIVFNESLESLPEDVKEKCLFYKY